ncbi:MAG: hypothetical protein C4304_08490 [candidate division GAL15 bacterium]
MRVRARVAFLITALLVGGGAHALWAQPVEVEGALRAEYEAASDTWLLEGSPVRLRQGVLVLEAHSVRYRGREGTFEAAGGVRVVYGDELAAQGQQAVGSVRERRAALEGDVRAAYRTADSPVQLVAPALELDFARRIARARGGVRVSWAEASLHAQEVWVDGPSEEVHAVGRPLVRWQDLDLVAGSLRADLRARVVWAAGGVRLEHPTAVAEASLAEVLWQDRVAVLRGAVVVRRGADQLVADQVRYAWQRGVLAAEGRSRVVVHP